VSSDATLWFAVEQQVTALHLSMREAAAFVALLVGLTGQNRGTILGTPAAHHRPDGYTEQGPATAVVELDKPRRGRRRHMDVALVDLPDWVAAPRDDDQARRHQCPLTHEVLDELPADKTLAHLRSVLVATGALPARDERLVALDAWITNAVHARTDPAERRVLHGYAVWHHLRRLRLRLGHQHTTHLQALNVRCHVTAAANFLTWLTEDELTLNTCTQADLDRWISNPKASYRDETGHFVRWAVQHRHANGLTYRTVRWTGPTGALDTEKRWADARRLLHDDTLPAGDRVAGLLVLLYAQRIATISQLTIDDVHLESDRVEIRFGTSPVVLPEPLAALVRDLVTTRRGKVKIGTPGDVPWLFPGGPPRTTHRRRPAWPAPPQDRHPTPARPLHRVVRPSHRAPRRNSRPDARRPHQGRRPMAAGCRRGLDRVRGRR
jgi:hypothetical protein